MKMVRYIHHVAFLLAAITFAGCSPRQTEPSTPNIVLIYTDDLGYGDISSYGATEITTPQIDRLAAEGLRFTHAHAPAATCTPSRYSLLTGEYAWRREGTGIARGNAAMIIKAGRTTLASVLQEAGYRTGVVGKWHLGLGGEGGPDWNEEIVPGPREIGFEYSFLIPATGDRVPTVYVENGRVVGLDPADPIEVSFDGPIGDEPTGRQHPELLKMHPSHGHDMTIVNEISRIGYMTGGNAARWVDEDMADVITEKAVSFIEKNKDDRFFLYFATHDIHVPRVPHERFAGKTGMGPRGDATAQMDWCVGEILDALDRLDLSENTLVIFSSDNGPVVDDGYHDQAVELLGNHMPSGPFRGGKYSAFEAGTRVPLIVRWPLHVDGGRSTDALFSQVDFLASIAGLTGIELRDGEAPDSFDMLGTLLGKDNSGRPWLIEQSGTLSIIENGWKYISPSSRPAYNSNVDIELGNDPAPQLYNLGSDRAERENVADDYPEVVERLDSLLSAVRQAEEQQQ